MYLSFKICLFSNYFSIAEIPFYQTNKAKIWLELRELNEEYHGVIDYENKTASMILWQHRLMVAHEKNANRLLELTSSQGFYIHMDDYTMPGTKCFLYIVYLI